MKNGQDFDVAAALAKDDSIREAIHATTPDSGLDLPISGRGRPDAPDTVLDGFAKTLSQACLPILVISRRFQKLEFRFAMKPDRNHPSFSRNFLNTSSAGMSSASPLSICSHRRAISIRHSSERGKSFSDSRLSQSRSARNARSGSSKFRADSRICLAWLVMVRCYISRPSRVKMRPYIAIKAAPGSSPSAGR